MSTHETIGSSNPSSSSTPIGSSESPLMVDEDNGTPCSSPTPMDAQIDGQPENKDVEGIGKLTSNVLLEWNIDRKLSTVTMDNCSTNDAVINIIIDKLQRSSLVMCGSMLHMRCAAHVLNLIVQDGLSVIGPCIEKVRDSVGFWTASTKRRQRESAYNCMPNEEDWEIASDICQRLSLFYKVTEVFSGTSYPTANLFFPKVCEIKIALNLWFTSTNDVIRSMAFRMLEKFDSYWNVIHGVMVVATILDLRYKIELLEYYFPIIYGDQVDDEIQRIRDICYEMLRDYNSGRMGKEANRGTCLDHYLEDDLMPRTLDFDILAWWKANGPKYPTLQWIARDILAIPVSTVASESTFNISERLLSPHRSKLHPKTVEALTCAQNWLWAGIKGTSSTKEEDMDIQNILDDYDDEDESGVTRVEESKNDS
uniref:HAT C-terminal dimerisation domain-containing protein n=1 Tax=Fagus sylvatica TaxID=28930 RepID=A0A2N9IB42_FAGSY